MEGVIIQTERVYRGVPVAFAVVLILAMAAFLTWLLLNTIKFCKRNKNKIALCSCIFAATLALCTALSGLAINGAMTIHKDLIITIDDSVGFNEFTELYEVISKDGNLYTVRELTNHTEVSDE